MKTEPSGRPAPRLLAGKRIGVVGLGLIGGSLVRSLSRHRTRLSVYGYDANPVPEARRHCHLCSSLGELVAVSDVLILAVPVTTEIGLMPEIARLARTRGQPGRRLLVLDAGTVKAPVLAAARRYRRAFDFVGLHPLAGTEHAGWRASNASLFVDRIFVYCPVNSRLDGGARELIRLVGGRPLPLDPKAHDRFEAESIGLPHIVAFAGAALAARDRTNAIRGGSWHSMTRVAASDTEMVGAFLEANAVEQLRVLKRFRTELDRFAAALAARDGGRIRELLTDRAPTASRRKRAAARRS